MPFIPDHWALYFFQDWIHPNHRVLIHIFRHFSLIVSLINGFFHAFSSKSLSCFAFVENPSGTTKTSSNTTSIVLRVVIPIVIIAIIVIAVVVYTKKRQRSSGVVRHDQPQTASMVSTQQKTAQQTSQTASSMPSEKYAFNKTQYVYPTATVQGVGYPQGPYPVSYGTGPTYPTGQYTTSAYGAAQMSFMVPPAYSSTPVGAVQPLLPSGVQGQQPTGTVNPSYDGNTLPPIESSPNVPPPTYQEATCS